MKNDYKDLMAKIEKGLHEHHANNASEAAAAAAAPARSSTAGPSTSTGLTNRAAAPAAIEAPFAKVNSVVPSSPAETAGLKAGDKITKFGYVNWMNHEKLSKVAQIVQQNEGVSYKDYRHNWKLTMHKRPIAIKVSRSAPTGGGSETIEMELTPRHNWGGRGMLGCHLLPL